MEVKTMDNIINIAKKLSIDEKDIELYGYDKAKINFESYQNYKRDGNLILVTTMTPTKVGEGKTTTVISLADGLNAINKKAIVCLREPSLGPVFGLKGGGTGGGKSLVVPEDDINLHFTGDIHAITTINNLIAAFIDNEIFQNSSLNLDPSRIAFNRAIDINDRSLREIETCLANKSGTPHRSKFVITTASEIMACFSLAKDIDDFINKVDNILIGYSYDLKPHYVKELCLDNAIKKLIKHAIKPNLVQTLYGTPAIIHGGPFANIAHGTNSIIATDLSLKLAPYVITEAGFGADLGMEKFFDIVCSRNNLKPKLVVMVATIQALKIHGGVLFDDLKKEDVEKMLLGTKNLKFHLDNVKKFNVDCIISINVHDSDTDNEIKALCKYLDSINVKYALNTSFKDGQSGAIELAELTVDSLTHSTSDFKPLYDDNLDIYTKIKTIASNMYNSSDVIYAGNVKEELDKLNTDQYKNFKICISKTPMSISDDPKLLNVPSNVLHVNSLRVFYGAKFIVPMSGSIISMPGLNKNPRGKNMKD